jgi:hypothetical protein
LDRKEKAMTDEGTHNKLKVAPDCHTEELDNGVVSMGEATPTNDRLIVAHGIAEPEILLNTLPNAAECDDEAQPRIVISPASPVLRVRESQQFTATVYGLDDSAVIWGLRSPEHGDILSDGYYTAPNTPGIYEVIARSVEDTGLYALALVTVKEYPR